jgi:hypothetical protein
MVVESMSEETVYGRESGDWSDGPPESEIELRPGDHGTCAVCGRDIVLMIKTGLYTPDEVPSVVYGQVKDVLEWEHSDLWGESMKNKDVAAGRADPGTIGDHVAVLGGGADGA